jgi:O-succinylbenzoic acid--CoA ligase
MLLALLQIGAVIIPLNTRLTAAEIIYQVKSSDTRFVLFDDDFHNIAQEIAVSNVPTLSFSAARQPDRIVPQVPRDFDLDDTLAIIHTSGTSGRPKGAVLTYGNFFYSAMASAYRLGHQPDDVWLCALPLYHVGGLSIIVRSMLYGITVELHERFDVDAINQALDTRYITLISLVPTMLYRLLESRQSWPNSLRLILLGGSAASPELLARCRDLGLPVATSYGLTEATSQAATMLPDDVNRKPGGVGKPLMFTNIRIVNEKGNSVAPYKFGEIVVRGLTVMKGYFDDPEATASAIRNGELFTGDIGYLDDEGDLFVVQRRSDLIVSGGENVYPAEVEAVLNQHPSVEEVAVVGLPNFEWGQQVAAAVKLKAGKNTTEEDLLTFSRAHLASYKLPQRIVFVPELPQTSSGKIQRSAVVALFAAGD